jgi:hypothetical protein
LKSVSAPINVIIDNEKPVPRCEFEEGPSIGSTGSGVLKDPQLTYSVSDNCGAPVNLKVEGFSNELEDGNSQILIYEKPLDENENRRIGFYVSSSICSTNSNGKCISDPNGRRFYVARITATDQAGLVDTFECSVEVVKNGNTNVDDTMLTPSQYFLLETYNFPAFNAEITPTNTT